MRKIWISLSLLALCFVGCQGKNQAKTDAKPVSDTSQTAENTPPNTPKASKTDISMLEKSPDSKLKLLGDASEDEKTQIRDVFAKFKAAVLGYRGEMAADMLAQSSLDYYENILTGVRMYVFEPEAYRVIENRLSPTNRATIQIMAERLSREYLAKTDARGLYTTAFTQGWIGYKTLQTASIDYMRRFDDQGKSYIMADFYYAGTIKDKNLNQIGFVFENDQWKVDLVPIFLTLDEAIQKNMLQKQLDKDLSIDMTVDSTREALEPNAWKLAKYNKDNFIIGFPRAPLFKDEAGEHIYTSQHHIYGQFDVRVSYYDGKLPDSPYQTKAARDQIILSFLNPLGVKSPRCTQNIVDYDIVIKCDFVIQDPPSQGKTVWFFTPDRVYHLFNLARADKYNDDAAAVFMQRFAYGMK